MGALDKRVYFSYAAFASALLFIVAGVLLYTSGASDPAADANNIGLTVTAIAGILAFIFSFPHTTRDNSFVRQISASLLMVSGVVFAISAIYDGSEWIFATAGVLAGAAIVVDMLALWVSRVYGAMYVSAVLGAVVLVMGIMSFVNGYTPGYTLAMFLAFGIWLVMSGWVLGFTESDDGSRTREVVEAAVSEKKEKPQAQNKKATPKAKKAEPKKADDAEEKKVRTVELPDTAASKEAVQKTQQPAPKAEEAPAEEPKEEPKAEPQKPPAKAMGDFMQKLMSSQAANEMAAPKKAEPVPEPTVPAEETAEAPAEEPEAVEEAPAETPAETPAEETAAEPEEEVPVEETVEDAPVEGPAAEIEPEESVIAEPVEPKASDEFQAKEPNWSVVTRDSSSEEKAEEKAEEAAPARTLAPKRSEEVPEETPAEEPAATAEETPEDAAEEAAEEPAEAPAEEPAEEPEAEPEEEAPADVPAVEDAPAETPADAPAATPSETPSEEPAPAEEEEALGEDLYTDNSPEALVRRAAWNKGLRCRRGYGERNIPVAFVKGKVAVYVDEPGADTSVDEELRAEGWTVLRYNAADVTDGKAQGDEIAAAVKANTRASKKKGRK